jgi:hypothetical protein
LRKEIWLLQYTDKTWNIDSLRPFAGTDAVIEYVQDFEARQATRNLVFILKKAGWNIKSLRPFTNGVSRDIPESMQRNVIIDKFRIARNKDGSSFTSEQVMSERSAQRAEEALSEFLFGENGWETRPWYPERGTMPLNQVRILVGRRPNPFAMDPQSVESAMEMMKRFRQHFLEKPAKVVENQWPPDLSLFLPVN